MKPMLAATLENVKDVKFPVLGSPKLDGIRALVIDGVLYSRNLKPIPNRYVQKSLPLKHMDGWDGELIVGSATADDCFRKTSSGVMSADGEPDFIFFVFDFIPKGDIKFADRYTGLKKNIRDLNHPRIKVVPHEKLTDAFNMSDYEEKMLAKGFEGVMLRSFDGAYKFGRATVREGSLMKVKQFSDSEAVILGFDEQMENTNEQTKDELGRSKRSSHKRGKVGKATLGSLSVRDIHTGVEFDVGTGFDDNLRNTIWNNRAHYKGKFIKYKFFPTGSKDKPRFPVFIGFRDKNDIS